MRQVIPPPAFVLHPAVQRHLAAAVPPVVAPLPLVHVAVGGGVRALAVPQVAQRLALARVGTMGAGPSRQESDMCSSDTHRDPTTQPQSASCVPGLTPCRKGAVEGEGAVEAAASAQIGGDSTTASQPSHLVDVSVGEVQHLLPYSEVLRALETLEQGGPAEQGQAAMWRCR